MSEKETDPSVNEESTSSQEEEEGSSPDNPAISSEEFEKIKAEKADLAERLAKLEQKDHNFEALRKKRLADIELTKEEKEALLEDEMKKINERQEEFMKNQYESKVTSLVRQFGMNSDEEGRKKLRLQFDRLSAADQPKSDDDLFATMRDAARLSDIDSKPTLDPVSNAASFYGSMPPKRNKKTDYTSTEDGKKLADKIGLDLEAYNKAKKEGKIK